MNIIVTGCGGKMGRAIVQMAQEKGISILCGVDKFPPEGLPFPVYTEITRCETPVDVVIDFSRPDALPSLLAYGLKYKVPLVLATTGYSDEDKAAIRSAAETIPIFQTGNMSLGVNVITALCEKAASVLGEDCDIEIIETHHNQKVDSPSGTALMLADAINHTYRDAMVYTYGRHGHNTKRSRGEIGIHAVRGGSVVGEHQVMFFTGQEKITVSHSAFDRKVFAAGALRAAEYLCDKPAGIYAMADVVGAAEALVLSAVEGLAFVELSCDTAADAHIALQQLGEIQGVQLVKAGDSWRLNGILPQKERYAAEKTFPEAKITAGVLKISLQGESLLRRKDAALAAFKAAQDAGAELLGFDAQGDRITLYAEEVFRRSLLETLMKEFGI